MLIDCPFLLSGNRVAVALETVPEESNITYLSYTVSHTNNVRDVTQLHTVLIIPKNH